MRLMMMRMVRMRMMMITRLHRAHDDDGDDEDDDDVVDGRHEAAQRIGRFNQIQILMHTQTRRKRQTLCSSGAECLAQ
eukprot:11518312-Karenia_brevis.AAC.1